MNSVDLTLSDLEIVFIAVEHECLRYRGNASDSEQRRHDSLSDLRRFIKQIMYQVENLVPIRCGSWNQNQNRAMLCASTPDEPDEVIDIPFAISQYKLVIEALEKLKQDGEREIARSEKNLEQLEKICDQLENIITFSPTTIWTEQQMSDLIDEMDEHSLGWEWFIESVITNQSLCDRFGLTQIWANPHLIECTRCGAKPGYSCRTAADNISATPHSARTHNSRLYQFLGPDAKVKAQQLDEDEDRIDRAQLEIADNLITQVREIYDKASRITVVSLVTDCS